MKILACMKIKQKGIIMAENKKRGQSSDDSAHILHALHRVELALEKQSTRNEDVIRRVGNLEADAKEDRKIITSIRITMAKYTGIGVASALIIEKLAELGGF